METKKISDTIARRELHYQLWGQYISGYPSVKRWQRDGAPVVKVVEIRPFVGGESRLCWVYAQDGQRFTVRQPRHWITQTMFDKLYRQVEDAKVTKR